MRFPLPKLLASCPALYLSRAVHIALYPPVALGFCTLAALPDVARLYPSFFLFKGKALLLVFLYLLGLTFSAAA